MVRLTEIVLHLRVRYVKLLDNHTGSSDLGGMLLSSELVVPLVVLWEGMLNFRSEHVNVIAAPYEGTHARQ
jgi:hypothetical protein